MLDVVVGGQAGDEGKGKIASYLCVKDDYDVAVRIGGPQAGHSIILGKDKIGLKTVSSGFLNPKTRLMVGAGSYIIVDWFLEEVKKTKTKKRIKIDPKAVVITKELMNTERGDDNLMKKIGSVGSGQGKALKEKIDRIILKENPLVTKTKFAKDVPKLKDYIADVTEEVNIALALGKKVLIEGTQGSKLSFIHGEYPYVTTRDSTASTFLAEVGVGPKFVKDVYVVYKPYTTRVGPGPLENEIFDEKYLENLHTKGGEIGSVSKRKRRAGEFEWETAVRANMLNGATKLVITHLDMLCGWSSKYENIDDQAEEFIEKFKGLEKCFPYPKLGLISYGPDLNDIIDLR